MLKISDLKESKELAPGEMAGVVGGISDLERLSAFLDFSSSITNKVANVQQAFGLNLAQSNAGTVTNNQAIQAGNGVVFAPVYQTQVQDNFMDLLGIGNTAVA